MQSREQKDEECDTTDDDSSTAAGHPNKNLSLLLFYPVNLLNDPPELRNYWEQF
jgi:hypothetical protein